MSIIPILTYSQTDCGLPSIHFDKNSTVIKQEFIQNLNYIGMFLLENPSKKLCLTGYAPENKTLGVKRAERAVEFLIQDCKIGVERLQIDYIYQKNTIRDGHSGALIKNPILDYLNSRVDFECM